MSGVLSNDELVVTSTLDSGATVISSGMDLSSLSGSGDGMGAGFDVYDVSNNLQFTVTEGDNWEFFGGDGLAVDFDTPSVEGRRRITFDHFTSAG